MTNNHTSPPIAANKPYLDLQLAAEDVQAFDAIYDRVVAASDIMRLRRAGDSIDFSDERGEGICVYASNRIVLFFHVYPPDGTCHFFYVCPGGGSTCLSNPQLNEVWCFSSKGNLWAKNDTQRSQKIFKNSFETHYPPIKRKSGGKKGGADDDPGLNGPTFSLSQEDLKSLGM